MKRKTKSEGGKRGEGGRGEGKQESKRKERKREGCPATNGKNLS